MQDVHLAGSASFIHLNAMESGGVSPMPPPSGTATPSAAAVPSGLSHVTNAADVGKPKKAKICVYCGSSTGKNPVYMEAARELARAMAKHDIGLGESPFYCPLFYAFPLTNKSMAAARLA